MKKIMTLLNNIIIGICCFGIIINILHFIEIRYSYPIDFDGWNGKQKNTLNNISTTLNKINVNNYKGNLSKTFLIEAKKQLNLCVNELNSSAIFEYIGTKKITIKDIEKMKYIVNETNCRSELQWFYNIKGNNKFSSIEQEQFDDIMPYIYDIQLLKLLTLFGVEKDIYRTSYYYVYDPLNYAERGSATNNVYWNYVSIIDVNKTTINIVQSLSNWLVEETGGDSK